jgi:NAD(P)-dependent dehydrogenase (short-subunit alcohol dehydrogenase family)
MGSHSLKDQVLAGALEGGSSCASSTQPDRGSAGVACCMEGGWQNGPATAASEIFRVPPDWHGALASRFHRAAFIFQMNHCGAAFGPVRVLAGFLENVARSNRKLVVTITSGMGSIADNTAGGYIPYRSSKAAVNMVMRTAAIDLAPRSLSCVLVNPGWVRTDMGGSSAPLSAQESVTALRRLIQTFGPAHSGKFFNHDGREYPW